MTQQNYIPVIGLEVHIELATASKMFCSCPADHFAQAPNTLVCPVCLGLPGALPFVNQKAIEDTIEFGLALNCTINNFSKFDRKHYFYPDLPKGYQISQYDLPICKDGTLLGIKIRRIHIEEDTGKLQHINDKSLIDFNRSGVPLMELVTEPDFDSVDKVISFLKEVQRIVRYLKISSADMEKGSMRLEANISIREESQKDLPNYKVELKNINSFRFVKAALEAEITRQKANPHDRKLETRGFNEKTRTTFLQRTKEEAHDYRYFPEPDIPPLEIADSTIAKLSQHLPELPEKKREKYQKLGLPRNYIEVLVDNQAKAQYFESAIKEHIEGITPKDIAGLMVNQNLDKDFEEPALMVKKIYELLKKDYANDSDTKSACQKTLQDNPKAVKDYKLGKTSVIGFLIGQVQKELKGKGNPQIIHNLIIKLLDIKRS